MLAGMNIMMDIVSLDSHILASAYFCFVQTSFLCGWLFLRSWYHGSAWVSLHSSKRVHR